MRVVAVVGPGERATAEQIASAAAVGAACARRGWAVLTGGRAAGVMDAASRGAHDAGGLAIAFLPGADRVGATPHAALQLPTALGQARNAVIAQGADAMVACGLCAGTLAEVALALRVGTPVVVLHAPPAAAACFAELAPAAPLLAGDAAEAMALVERRLGRAPNA